MTARVAGDQAVATGVAAILPRRIAWIGAVLGAVVTIAFGVGQLRRGALGCRGLGHLGIVCPSRRCLLPLPAIHAASSAYSGALVARHAFRIVALCLPLRSAVALAVVVAATGGSVVPAAAGLTLGESIRLAILWAAFRRSSPLTASHAANSTASASAFFRRCGLQASSMMVVGLIPLVDRVVAGHFEAGSVTVVELADKFFYAALLLSMSGWSVSRARMGGSLNEWDPTSRFFRLLQPQHHPRRHFRHRVGGMLAGAVIWARVDRPLLLTVG